MPVEALLLEAERRGILPPEQASALAEARKRGLIAGQPVEPQPGDMIDVGGGKIKIPANASEDAVKKAVADYRTTPEFDKLVDKDRGSPARVRMLVGSAPEGDKLANLRRFYPDAQPYGEDNFVFTDPESGRPTLHNPQGLDFGDVAGTAREITQAAFSAGGAALGAIGGSVVPGPGTFAGGIVGAGAGNAFGGAVFDAAVDIIGGRIDTRGPLDRITDTGIDFIFGAAGQKAGEVISAGAKAALTKGKPFVSEMVNKFRSLGIDPPAGAVSGSKTVQGLEKSLEGTIAGGDILQKQAETVLAQTKAAAEKVANSFGQVQTRAGAGATIKEAAAGVREVFEARQEALYKTAFAKVGDDTLASVDAVTVLREELEQQLAGAPETLVKTLSPAINQLKAIEADAADGLAFSSLREIRTMIGREIKQPALGETSGAVQANLKRIYGALTLDMSKAAQDAGPDAASAIRHADRYTKAFMGDAAKLMDKIQRFDADEKAFDFLMTASRDNARGLAKLRGYFTNEEWDTVAATVINRLGQARPGAQDAAGEAFSVSTFLTNWNKLSPEAKKTMFSGKRYGNLLPELEKLTEVIGSLKDVEKLANHSNTAKAMVTYMTLQALGGAAVAAASGNADAGSLVMGAAGGFIAPRMAARLITSPRFVRWLAADVAPNGIGAHIGRLTAIAVAEPEISEEIEQYTQALRSIDTPR